MKIKNVLRGARNQHAGAAFESVFFDACLNEMIVIERMPDGCKQVGANRLIRVKTPWDFILTRSGKTAYIDTKTTNDPKFTFSAIEKHQADAMFKHAREGAPNVTAGYVIELRQTDEVIFVPAWCLHTAVHCGAKGSFGPGDGGVITLGKSFKMGVWQIWL